MQVFNSNRIQTPYARSYYSVLPPTCVMSDVKSFSFWQRDCTLLFLYDKLYHWNVVFYFWFLWILRNCTFSFWKMEEDKFRDIKVIIPLHYIEKWYTYSWKSCIIRMLFSTCKLQLCYQCLCKMANQHLKSSVYLCSYWKPPTSQSLSFL